MNTVLGKFIRMTILEWSRCEFLGSGGTTYNYQCSGGIDATDVNGWKLTDPRSEEAVTLHLRLTTTHYPRSSNLKDSCSCTVEGVKCNGFSSKLSWEAIRPKGGGERLVQSGVVQRSNEA
ncbi:unnamed protein product [Microthlaspi erraticum]|uniref:Uncharacterized protein n=1 Tax=Microthlaspi erraticum TaxID=1685480 RepID=A0A6D2HIE3_9BRAS|nr:unnamed protein product [Microthlaspi erraticum]